MAGKANFALIKGDTFNKNVTFRSKTSQTPVNLTGATISGKVKKGTSTHPLTCAVVNAAQGKFSFGLPAATSASLDTGTHVIDVAITYQDGTVKTIITGNLVVQ